LDGKISEKDDYKVCFSGATITQRESNKAGVALLFGFIGIAVIDIAFENSEQTGAIRNCVDFGVHWVFRYCQSALQK